MCLQGRALPEESLKVDRFFGGPFLTISSLSAVDSFFHVKGSLEVITCSGQAGSYSLQQFFAEGDCQSLFFYPPHSAGGAVQTTAALPRFATTGPLFYVDTSFRAPFFCKHLYRSSNICLLHTFMLGLDSCRPKANTPSARSLNIFRWKHKLANRKIQKYKEVAQFCCTICEVLVYVAFVLR